MLALPAGITMVIVLAAVHALMAPLHGLSADKAGGGVSPLPAHSPPATAQPTPTDGAVIFPLPDHGTAHPSRPPGPTPPAHQDHDGPVSGPYYMKSFNGGCFDIGYTTNQTPMVAQRPCSTSPPMARFDLQALGEGRYRMSAVAQRGITAGQALCLSSAGSDRMMVFDGCETTRADQLMTFVETSEEWYQIQVPGGCVTAMGHDARTKACANSQAQLFTFTPIN